MSLIEALADTNHKVEHLLLEDVPWVSLSDITNFNFYLNIRPLIAPTLWNLVSLTLNLWVHGTFMPLIDGIKGRVSVLCDLLNGTPFLEELVLGPYQIFWDPDAIGQVSEEEAQIDTTDVFSQLTWPHLRTLSVSDCLVGTEAFINFMKRHSSTVKDLHLRNIKLTDFPIGAPNFRVATRTSIHECPSAWEWTIKQLAPYFLHLNHADTERMTDEELVSRIAQGDKNGISVEWLVKSWRMELTMYFDYWDPTPCLRPHFPVYGEPRMVAYEMENYGDDD